MKKIVLFVSLFLFVETSKADEPLKNQRLISLQANQTISDCKTEFRMNVLSINRPLVQEGNLVLYQDAGTITVMPSDKKMRSPIIAGAFSLLLPGAGEFYAESYVRSALFFVAEVAIWSLAISTQNNGRQQERNFVTFADEPAPTGSGFANDGRTRWDAVRFAERMSEIYTTERFLNSGTVSNANLIRQRAAELGTESRLNEVRNRDYRFLNDFERIAVSAANNATLSHTLPPYGDQQYYELIGKYSEYAIGWYDYDVTRMNNNFEIHSSSYLQYAGMRGMANATLKDASTYFSLVILNRALSMVDALIATNDYNDRIRTSFQLQQDAMTRTIYPSASFSMSF